jgi:tetratricopeptide (TPR) repeat protein
MGLICEKKNELEAAAGFMARALAGDAHLVPAYGDLARIQTSRKLYKDAAQVYQKALESGSANPLPIYRELGRLCETHLDDAEQAVYWYQRMLTQGGEDREVLERFKKLASRVSIHPGPAGRGLSA